MLIQHKESGNKGSFFVAGNSATLAEMDYTMASPHKMIIENTEVDDQLRDKNVGCQLVHTAVEYARANNIKIIPLCPFCHPDPSTKLRTIGTVLKKTGACRCSLYSIMPYK